MSRTMPRSSRLPGRLTELTTRILELLHTSECLTSAYVMELLNVGIAERHNVCYVLSVLGGVGLLSRATRQRGCHRRWYRAPGSRKDCVKRNIGIIYLHVRTNPGVFCVRDLAERLSVPLRRMYDIVQVLMGLGVVTDPETGNHKLATPLPSDPVLPWHRALDYVWGDSREPTLSSHVVQSVPPECQVARITSDTPISKSPSTAVESDGTESESLENKAGRMDTTDLPFGNFQFDDFTMELPESKVDWTNTDSLRGCLLWLDVETEDVFPFKRNTGYPTPLDFAKMI